MAKSPENQFKQWTESDVAELQAFVDEDMSVEEIARELGRTVEAVRAKAAEEGISLLRAQRWATSTSDRQAHCDSSRATLGQTRQVRASCHSPVA